MKNWQKLLTLALLTLVVAGFGVFIALKADQTARERTNQ